MGKDSFTSRSGEDVVVEPDDTARGDVEFEECTIALRLHHRHLTLAARDDIDDLARRLLGEVHREQLCGLVGYAVDLVDDDLRLTDL